MQLKNLTPDIYVSAQIDPADVSELARLGFKSIICNRPDSEASDQPLWAEIAAAAEHHSLATSFIPVVPRHISDADVAAFSSALDRLPKPIAVFCRTGTRSAMLWALANPERMSADERLLRTAACGYELSALHDRLEKIQP